MVFLKGKSGRRERAQFTSVESIWSWRPLSVAATCCYAGTPAPCRARAVTFGQIFIKIDVKKHYTTGVIHQVLLSVKECGPECGIRQSEPDKKEKLSRERKSFAVTPASCETRLATLAEVNVK